jgi:3',5'-cyclic-AMP phosphodiesterase
VARVRTIAHVSDLHLGRDALTDRRARALARALQHADVDAVLVTGDVTHRGLARELFAFERAFAPVADRLVVVPGNHDRAGDDAGAAFMRAGRVGVTRREGLFVVRVDSTAPHNRSLIDSHGRLDEEDLAGVAAAVAAADPDDLAVVMLHHHPLPLPFDHIGERLATWLGWPNAAELPLGRALLELLLGRCDLVLHGHRHAASESVIAAPNGRSLRVLNAGSSPELGRFRVMAHRGRRVVSDGWLAVAGDERRLPAVDALTQAASYDLSRLARPLAKAS